MDSRRQTIVETALEEWSRHVEEPPDKGWERIDEYIRGNLGLVWRWLKRKYRRNGQFEWCGAFAAFCYGVAGLRPRLRRKHLASCYRLWKWSGGSTPNHRRLKLQDIEAGDIVVVGPRPAPRTASKKLKKRRPRWGKHIVIAAESYRSHGHQLKTIEGNAHGKLPDGRHEEGVVRRSRPFLVTDDAEYRILFAYRPLEGDW
jgi:hypothetical protein